MLTMQAQACVSADQYADYKWLGRKFAADQYAGYKWLGRKSLLISWGATFYVSGGSMIENGFYIIKDKFFEDFPDPYLKSNKGEHRPHYFALKDKKSGLFWMIPMSSQLGKYRALIKRQEERGKQCKTLHICRLDSGRESVFLIQDIFPVSEMYIQRAYTIGTNHLRLTKDAQVRIVRSKAESVLAMIRRGIKFTPTQPNALSIEKALLGSTKKSAK